jgi:hypothetical protein
MKKNIIYTVFIIAIALGSFWTYTKAANMAVTFCYKTNGQIRLLTSTLAKCDSNETPLSLSSSSTPGPQGPKGTVATTTTVLSTATSTTLIPAGTELTAQATCPVGKILLSGGGEVTFVQTVGSPLITSQVSAGGGGEAGGGDGVEDPSAEVPFAALTSSIPTSSNGWKATARLINGGTKFHVMKVTAEAVCGQ